MIINEARTVLKEDAEAIIDLSNKIGDSFLHLIDYILKNESTVIIMGLGKTGIIGQKISATLASTGTKSFWIHATEAFHGDFGRIKKNDLVLVLSHSGETDEINRCLPIIRNMQAKIALITSNPNSTAAKMSDVILETYVRKESSPYGLAPTTSTTVMLALGDAIAVSLQKEKRFNENDFARYHPGGILGKRLLLKAKDIMRTGERNPIVKIDVSVKVALFTMTKARTGAVSIVGIDGKLKGVFTDGDLRRHIEVDPNIVDKPVSLFMTKNPISTKTDSLAIEVMKKMNLKKIDDIPVVDSNNNPVGILDIQDLVNAGLI